MSRHRHNQHTHIIKLRNLLERIGVSEPGEISSTHTHTCMHTRACTYSGEHNYGIIYWLRTVNADMSLLFLQSSLPLLTALKDCHSNNLSAAWWNNQAQEWRDCVFPKPRPTLYLLSNFLPATGSEILLSQQMTMSSPNNRYLVTGPEIR